MSRAWVVIATPYHVPYQIPFFFEHREHALEMITHRINDHIITNLFLKQKDIDFLKETLYSIRYGFFQPLVIDYVKWDLREINQ